MFGNDAIRFFGDVERGSNRDNRALPVIGLIATIGKRRCDLLEQLKLWFFAQFAEDKVGLERRQHLQIGVLAVAHVDRHGLDVWPQVKDVANGLPPLFFIDVLRLRKTGCLHA
jgi:hypothetical protein